MAKPTQDFSNGFRMFNETFIYIRKILGWLYIQGLKLRLAKSQMRV